MKIKNETPINGKLEQALLDVGEVGMFAVSSACLSAGVRSGAYSWRDVYQTHRKFAKEGGWGDNTELPINDNGLEVDLHAEESAKSIMVEIANHGFENLDCKSRWDLNYLSRHGIIDMDEIEAEHKKDLALRDYDHILAHDVGTLKTQDNLAYGINTGLFSFGDVESRQDKYYLGEVEDMIFLLGKDGIDEETRDYVEHCFEKGLITPEEIDYIDSRRNIVSIKDYIDSLV